MITLKFLTNLLQKSVTEPGNEPRTVMHVSSRINQLKRKLAHVSRLHKSTREKLAHVIVF